MQAHSLYIFIAYGAGLAVLLWIALIPLVKHRSLVRRLRRRLREEHTKRESNP